MLRQTESRWPRRLAIALAAITFPLIWVGSLVTTYKAGMAVPDWPDTYGYNLFLYPWQTWLLGPFDLLIEHGHRLLGATAGFVTIALVAVTWWCESRAWVRWFSFLLLSAVVGQGLLGGMRVVAENLDRTQLAQIHGCVGPLFFALATAFAVVTSNWWRSNCRPRPLAAAATIQRLAVFTTILAYVQLVLGSQLRHVSPVAPPSIFTTAVVLHVGAAMLLLVHVALLSYAVLRHARSEKAISRPTIGLLALIGLQIALGMSTWVFKYGWPVWADEFSFAGSFTVQAESFFQAWLTTAHVACGSLILVTSLVVALRSFRAFAVAPALPLTSSSKFTHTQPGHSQLLEAAR